MQIKKNVAAKLKAAMEERGETLAKFAAELDIPKSTLQGYLKETSCPRADSLEELAGKLGISLAELVSEAEYAGYDSASCLDQALLETQALHPSVKPTAEKAISILRSAFHMSDDLYDVEMLERSAVDQSDRYKYFLHEMRDPFRLMTTYGILAKERLPEGWITVAVVAAFSHDKAAVARLADRCSELQLSPEHLLDVVHDFLAKETVSA